MGWPMISAAVYPRSRLAEAFQEVIVPSSVLVMMASSDESTTAARKRPGIILRSLPDRRGISDLFLIF